MEAQFHEHKADGASRIESYWEYEGQREEPVLLMFLGETNNLIACVRLSDERLGNYSVFTVGT